MRHTFASGLGKAAWATVQMHDLISSIHTFGGVENSAYLSGNSATAALNLCCDVIMSSVTQRAVNVREAGYCVSEDFAGTSNANTACAVAAIYGASRLHGSNHW